MTTSKTLRRLIGAAAVAATAIALSACGSSAPADPAADAGSADSAADSGSDSGSDSGAADSSDGDSAASGEAITLTIATFNDFGYTDELLAEYSAANPTITIVHNRAATSDDARANYFQKLGKTGLADIEAIEIDWVPEVMQYSDLLAPVPDGLKGRWLDWKVAGASDADGNLMGYGTDIGPEAVCYRPDLFEDAGLPSDRDAVADLLDGDWANYFAVGDQYVAATGKAWFDSAGATWQGMINQVAAAYEDPATGAIIAADNAEVKAIYDQVLAASATQSSHLGQWSDDWNAGMSNGEYATMLCPGWMLGVIEGNAQGVTWDIAPVFPNGGGNWGGSYLTVPANGEHVAQAQALADWLTAPEQQIKAFVNAGTFPSQLDALTSPDLQGQTNAFFGDAPTGEIFSTMADAVAVSPFKGAHYFQVNTTFQDALTRVEEGLQDPAESWDQALAEIASIG